jgi:uncharacterized protein YecE (DUF72 family)
MAALSERVKFGTSTWTYEGWKGLVYRQVYPKGRFKADCLREYARHEYRGHPLFQTVGLDQSFYAPPTPDQLRHFTEQIPAGFEICSKVWEELTIPRFASHPRYGERAGRSNPRFLDPALFRDEILAPYRAAAAGHIGPFLFEFQRTGIEPHELIERLDTFFGQAPSDVPYAVEIRNPAVLSDRYHAMLKAHGVAHIYNHWCWMPALDEQHGRLAERFTASFTVLRLLTPLGISYEDAVKSATPYSRLVRTIPTMRRDAVRLVRQAAAEDRRAYVLVNNRAEGCAPLTIQALVDELTGRLEGPSQDP